MLTLYSLLTLLAADAVAAPTPHAPREKGTLQERQPSHIYQLKRHAPRTDSLRRRGNEGLLAYASDAGVEYTLPITVGTGDKAQTFDVLIDTGSADLWLTEVCTSAVICGNAPEYDHTLSPTFTNVSASLPPEVQQFSILYGDGTAPTGFWGNDQITVANASAFANFGVVNNINEDAVWNTTSTNRNGILGLGLSENTQQRTFDPKALAVWKYITNMYGLYLGRQPPPSEAEADGDTHPEAGGTLAVGDFDTSKYTGDIHWNDVAPMKDGTLGYWQVQVDEPLFNGKPVGGPLTGHVDCGTAILRGPPTFFANVLAGMGIDYDTYATARSTIAFYRCSETPSLNGLSFKIGGIDYPVQGADLKSASGPFEGAALAQTIGSTVPQPGEEWCRLALSTSDTTDDYMLGAPFMWNVYSAFRVDTPVPQIGFATLTPEANTIPTPA